jgi:hypothetical protein
MRDDGEEVRACPSRETDCKGQRPRVEKRLYVGARKGSHEMVQIKLLFQVGDGVCTVASLPSVFGKNILHSFC